MLYADAPQSTLQDVQCIIKEDLGQDIEQLFARFDTKPLGAASLAQARSTCFFSMTESKAIYITKVWRTVRNQQLCEYIEFHGSYSE